MNDKQLQKLSKYRKKKTDQKQGVALESNKNIIDGLSEIKELLQLFIDQPEKKDNTDAVILIEQYKGLSHAIGLLENSVANGIEIKNLDKINTIKELVVSNLKDIKIPKLDIPKDLAKSKDFVELQKSIDQVTKAIEGTKNKQSPDDYIPIRRVLKRGNVLEFDDSTWAAGAGGGSGGGGNAGGLTDAELRATPVPVSGTVTVDDTDDTTATGTIVANGGTVVAAVTPGMKGWVMAYQGTYSTGASLTMEVSFDSGATYKTCRMLAGTTSTLGYVLTIAAGVNGSSYYTADIPAGATHLRVRCSAWAAPTGTINVIIGQSPDRNITPTGAIVLTSGTVTTVSTLTNITNWGNIVDNAAFVDGTTRLMPGGYIYDEVAGTALTENDAAAARIDSKRAQIGVIEDATTRGQRAAVSAGGALKVDGSAVTQPVSGTITETNSSAIRTAVETLDNAISGSEMQVDVITMPTTTVTATNLDIRDLTNADVVTAELSATDNAVLDSIVTNTNPTTGLGTGRATVTTAGTAVAIASSTTCKWVAITAETNNTSIVTVGDSGVIAALATREGIPLNPGDTITIPIDNLADVYIDALVSTEGVSFLYGT